MTADLKNEAQKALDAYDKYESHRDALQFAAAIESLRKAVELQAPAEAHGEIVAWMYEHDGCNDEPILTVDRWPECREPWNETPLDVLALAKHAIEKVWLDAVCTDHGEHSISEAARTRVEFAADALKLGLRLTGVKPSAVPAPRIGKWGHCWTCNHDAIPGEGCARSQCPMLAAKTVPEPAWYAVTSLRAPCIDKVIRRLDVAEEYADKQREVWTDVEIVPLYTQPVPVADKPGARFIEKTNREYIAWCKTKYIPESLDERGMKSLDGLWAWQAQEHRYATQSNPQPKHTAPIDMVLHCPACGLQHIDAPEDADCDGEVAHSLGWSNPPHRSHLCHGCGHVWRPADVPTNGVKAIQTKGKADSPIQSPAPAQSAAYLTGDGKLHVTAWECHGCGHRGIDDGDDASEACSDCDWRGPCPDEDVCPGCGREETMVSACPKCGDRYYIKAEADIVIPAAAQAPAVGADGSRSTGAGNGVVTRCQDMAARIYMALGRYESDQGEDFVDTVFSSLLPDAHDLLILLAGAAESKAAVYERMRDRLNRASQPPVQPMGGE